MKTLTLSIILLLTAILLSFAQLNYECAIEAAINSEGSDIAIENAMYQYGFNVEALDPNEPTTTDKVKALFNHKN